MTIRGTVVLILVATGCVPASPRDRAYLSSSLEDRTGAPTGEDPRTAPSDAPGTNVADGIDEDEAVALAMWNNAALHATLEGLGFARADLAQAGALPNPTFTMFFPLGPKQFEFTLGWAFDWLWGRPYRVAAAKLDVERIAEELVARGLDTARDARVSHASVVRAEARLALAAEAAKTWKQIAHLARVRREAGAASLLEVNAVETDERAARIEAERARRGADAAHARLRETLGLTARAAVTPPAATDGKAFAIDDLVKAALAARPEVRAAELAIEGAGERSGWETARIFNLIGTLDYNGRAKELGPGLMLTIPLFDQNQAGRTRAETELRAASWRYLGVRQRIEREVYEAHAALDAATLTLQAWPTDVLDPLERNVGLATRAYEAGGATYLAVLDATRRLIEAKQRHADLLFEKRQALAELARAVGRKPE